MDKKQCFYQSVLTINSIIFIIFHLFDSLTAIHGILAVWSWTIWIHVIVNGIRVANMIVEEKKVLKSTVCNYIAQLLFLLLYVFGYALQVTSISKEILATLLSLLLIGIAFLNTRKIESNHQVKTNKELFSTKEIAEHIKGGLVHGVNTNMHILLVILNVLSLVLLLLVPVISLIINSNATLILILYIGIFSIFSYIKYQIIGFTFLVFLITVLPCIVVIGFYGYVSTSLIDGMPLVLLVMYLYLPYLIGYYKIAQRFHIQAENK